ncbi:MAG: sugar transferase [Peptostreptococcaceae bacterium]
MQKISKRFIDIVASSVGLILISPILLGIAILVRKKLGSPVFFIQERIGRDGKVFKMIKFRTMIDAYDNFGNVLSDEERLTYFGKKLRSTSLDELPELINVLKGDMSLVGPRPLLVEYKDLYSNHQWRRHEVRPGITGLSQVNGRNNLSFRERFDLDVNYVDNQNLFLDFKILLKTFKKVLKKDDINQDGNATMQKFNGEN